MLIAPQARLKSLLDSVALMVAKTVVKKDVKLLLKMLLKPRLWTSVLIQPVRNVRLQLSKNVRRNVNKLRS